MNEKSEQLYRLLIRRHYPEEFAREVCRYMNTDYTAKRMMGFLLQSKRALPMEEVADELLAILSDRDAIMRKKAAEYTNAKWNVFLNNGFEDEDE